MKQIELQLKKKILIVELPENELFSQEKQINALIDSDKWLHELLCQKRNLKLICKAYDLTEEICETLISKKDVAKNQSKMCGLKFKEGFINMVESKGCKFDLNKTLIFEIL